MSKFSETHPLNVLKFCPKCSATGFSFDGEKKFHCKTCNFEYYINGATAVCGIIELPDNRIILTRRKHNPKEGMLDLPGGFVDTMERAEDAIIREIKEELNLEVSEPLFLSSFPNEYPFKGISYYTCDLAFIFKINYIPVIEAADDVTEAVLTNPKEINFNDVGFQSIRNILQMYISKYNNK
jgi:ADP-ribose pyrophosphatase YjhB (NUDIX family)